MKAPLAFGLCFSFALAAAVSSLPSRSQAQVSPASVDATATLPPGPEGDLIGYGRDIINDTRKYMPANVGARLD